MELNVTIRLDEWPEQERAAEAGRILRYWAGAMKQIDLEAPAEHDLTDSAYRTVGSLRLG